MKNKLLPISLVLLTLLLSLHHVITPPRDNVLNKQIGNDVSWPNCKERKSTNNNWGIVGVNDGKILTTNPCLASEISWFPPGSLNLYINTGYYGIQAAQKYATWPKPCSPQDKLCLAYNDGYHTGTYAFTTAAKQGAHSMVWWLDVETINAWTTNTKENSSALLGMAAALEHNNPLATIGFYSTAYQWKIITGGWRNNTASWEPTGNNQLESAEKLCGRPGFTGGPITMTQYTLKLDMDYRCKN